MEKPIGSMYGITCLLVLCMVKCIGKLCKYPIHRSYKVGPLPVVSVITPFIGVK